ncbi:2-dehydropantoate 2-reductase [Bimuria novae-zelandiae CBS 107.79]|uniref:2-dehydropantoate 2-reductase n=1 Tax=Bimuria novae-zelandiae CBS 107.79 TaxID=1447943 RepID=A0A6A5VSI6_9PLEO|nr:2-dehydropantoate 2-reductase [Bimuria novae-zelandiae CBS 107.79]
MTSQERKVLFFGVGSVGSVYLYLLSKIVSTTAVCRSNYDVVKERGFTINSTVFGDGLHVAPHVDPHPFDYVILTCKVVPGIYPKIIKPVITPGHTVIALLQNGIGIEEEYATAFPENPILTVATYCATALGPPGVVTHKEVEKLEVGSYPSSAPNTRAQAFISLMQSTGATATLFDDVQVKRWYKLLLNSSWNLICALTLSLDVQFMQSSDGATDFVLDVMLETRDIAKAYGYEIATEEVKAQWERATEEPSMLQDLKAGRKREVEAIVGNVVRMARAKCVACGTLDTIYLLMKALDARMGGNK